MRAVYVLSALVMLAGLMCTENPNSITGGANALDECVWVETVGSTSNQVIAVVKLDAKAYSWNENSSQVLGFNSEDWNVGTPGVKDDSLWVHQVSGVKKGKVYTFVFKGSKGYGNNAFLKKSQYWVSSLNCLAVKIGSDGKATSAKASEVDSFSVIANGDTVRIVDSIIVRTTVYINVHDTVRSTDTITIMRTIRDSIFINNPTVIHDTIYIDRTLKVPFRVISASALSDGNYSCVVGYSFSGMFKSASGTEYFEQGLPSWDNVYHDLSSNMTSDSLRTISVILKNRTWYTTGYGSLKKNSGWTIIPAGTKYYYQGIIRFWFENGKAWEDNTLRSDSSVIYKTVHDTIYINQNSPRIQAVKLLQKVLKSDGSYDCLFGFLDTVVIGWRSASSFAEKGLPNWASAVSLNSGRTADGYQTAWINLPKYYHGTFAYYAVGGNWADTNKLKNSDYWVSGQNSLGFDFYAGNLYQYGGVVIDTLRINSRDSVVVNLPGKTDTLRIKDTTFITIRVVDTVRIVQARVDTVFKPLIVKDTVRLNDTLRIIQTRVDTLRIIDQKTDTIKTTVVHLDTVYLPQDVIVTVVKDTVIKIDTSVTNPVTVYLDPDSLIAAISRDSLIRRYTIVTTSTTRNGVLTKSVDTLNGMSTTVIPLLRDTVDNMVKLSEVGEEGSGDHLLTIALSDKVFKYSNPAETSAKLFGYKDDWATGIGNFQHVNGAYFFRISGVKDGEIFKINFQGGNGSWAVNINRSRYFKEGNISFVFNGTTNAMVKN